MKNFIIDLEYIVPIADIEPLMDGHMAYINEGKDKGVFISWGPKVPRTGGVILAVAESYEEIEAFCATDPFVAEKAAQVKITEFVARREIKSA